jgi:hypothetical protein
MPTSLPTIQLTFTCRSRRHLGISALLRQENPEAVVSMLARALIYEPASALRLPQFSPLLFCLLFQLFRFSQTFFSFKRFILQGQDAARLNYFDTKSVSRCVPDTTSQHPTHARSIPATFNQDTDSRLSLCSQYARHSPYHSHFRLLRYLLRRSPWSPRTPWPPDGPPGSKRPLLRRKVPRRSKGPRGKFPLSKEPRRSRSAVPRRRWPEATLHDDLVLRLSVSRNTQVQHMCL